MKKESPFELVKYTLLCLGGLAAFGYIYVKATIMLLGLPGVLALVGWVWLLTPPIVLLNALSDFIDRRRAEKSWEKYQRRHCGNVEPKSDLGKIIKKYSSEAQRNSSDE